MEQKQTKIFGFLFVMSACVLFPASAFALTDSEESCSAESGPTVVSDCGSVWDRFELSAGFLAGSRRYSGLSFSPEGDSSLSALYLLEPFQGTPFDDVPAFGGVRFEARAVMSHVRVTLGIDRPFPSFPGELRSFDVLGEETLVIVKSLSPREVRFGIGGELPLGPVGLYADVIGAVQVVDASLVVGNEQLDYSAMAFGFTARGGARLQLRRGFFVTAAGEVGLLGSVVWGAELSVGATLF